MVYSERDSTQKDTSSSAVTSSLSDLIARLEKATGPDRELDAEIFCAINHGFVTHHAAPGFAIKDQFGIIENGNLARSPYISSNRRVSPRYTSSIDAAMTLVPSTHLHMVGNAGLSDGVKEYRADVWGLEPRSSHIGLHDCEAIALCIAALKARSLPAI